jgi:Tat protein secretion system quality control protein TatD with DNase activity
MLPVHSQYLKLYPQSIVGETGLDKVARDMETKKVLWDEQMELFKTQFEIAKELQRPITVQFLPP